MHYHYKCFLGILLLITSGSAMFISGWWFMERIIINPLSLWLLCVAIPIIILGILLFFIGVLYFLIWMELS